MGDGPIEHVIQQVTIDTMLNNNELDISKGMNFVTCERSIKACSKPVAVNMNSK